MAMENSERHIPVKRASENASQWYQSAEQSSKKIKGTEEMSSIRELLKIEMEKMEAEMERFKLDRGKDQLMEAQQLEKEKQEGVDSIARAQNAAISKDDSRQQHLVGIIESELESKSSPILSHQSVEEEKSDDLSQQVQRTSEDEQINENIENVNSNNNNNNNNENNTINQAEENIDSQQSLKMSDRESTPSSLINDPLASLAGANRATTTERRTTTTTTTKRTVKSSDDFVPSATDIQQVRSESRTGSVSSSSPLYSAQNNDLSQQQQQQQHQQASSSSTTTTTSTSKQSGTKSGWSDSIQSPLIQDTEEGRVLKLRFDVTQYEPDEIVVKTVDNRLTVHAKHEERTENRSVYREYNREFHLPDGTDVEQIRSSLSKDGVLTVDCPLPSPQIHGASRRIPIEKV